MKKLFFFAAILALISCEKPAVEAHFTEIKNQTAYFDLINHSTSDIDKISLEIQFLDASGQVLQTDTFDYQMAVKNDLKRAPFLKAKDETFIVQKIPEFCEEASIHVLYIEPAK